MFVQESLLQRIHYLLEELSFHLFRRLREPLQGLPLLQTHVQDEEADQGHRPDLPAPDVPLRQGRQREPEHDARHRRRAQVVLHPQAIPTNRDSRIPLLFFNLREIIRRRNEAKEVVTLGALLRNKEKSKVVKDVLRVLTYSNT